MPFNVNLGFDVLSVDLTQSNKNTLQVFRAIYSSYFTLGFFVTHASVHDLLFL
jgi:hypothetical protein